MTNQNTIYTTKLILLVLGLSFFLTLAYASQDTTITGATLNCNDADYVFCDDFEDGVFNDNKFHNQNPNPCTEQNGHIQCQATGNGGNDESIYWNVTYRTLRDSQSFCLEWSQNDTNINGNDQAYGVDTAGWSSGGRIADTFTSQEFQTRVNGGSNLKLLDTVSTQVYKYQACHDSSNSSMNWEVYYGNNDTLIASHSRNADSYDVGSGFWILNFDNTLTNYFYITAWNGTSADAPYLSVPADTNNPYFLHSLEDFNRTNLDIDLWSYDINASDDIALDGFIVNDSNFNITFATGLLTMNSPYTVGVYPLLITINDTSNNINTSTMTVTVTQVNDTTKPVINLVTPLNESLVASPFDITFNASDDGSNDLICYLGTETISYSYEPIGFWRMEEINTTIIEDSSPNDFEAISINNIISVDSKGINATGNYARESLGTNEFINITHNNRFNFGNTIADLPFSATSWIRMDDATVFRILSTQEGAGMGNDWAFFTDNTDTLRLQLYDSSTAHLIGRASSNGYMTQFENQWIHVGFTYDGTSTTGGVNLYVNGEIVDTQNLATGVYTAMHNASKSLGICVINQNSPAPAICDGSIDEVAIFDFQLSQEEVQNIMNYGIINESSSTIYDTGIFTQDTNDILTYNGILPNEFDLTCFDNSLNNNSQFIHLSYETDSISPILTMYSPIDLSVYQLGVDNGSINMSCTDANFYKLNLTISNSSGFILESQETFNTSFFQEYDSADFGIGTFNIDALCYDTVFNFDEEFRQVFVTDSPYPIVTLLTPIDQQEFNPKIDEFPLLIDFNFNVTKDSNCSLYLDDVLNNSIITINNTLTSFNSTPFDSTVTQKDFYISCDDGSFMSNSETRTFFINIETETKELSLSLDSLENIFILFIFVILYIALMTLAFVFKNFGFGIFGFLIGIVLGLIFAQIHIILTFSFLFINALIFLKSISGFR